MAGEEAVCVTKGSWRGSVMQGQGFLHQDQTFLQSEMATTTYYLKKRYKIYNNNYTQIYTYADLFTAIVGN